MVVNRAVPIRGIGQIVSVSTITMGDTAVEKEEVGEIEMLWYMGFPHFFECESPRDYRFSILVPFDCCWGDSVGFKVVLDLFGCDFVSKCLIAN